MKGGLLVQTLGGLIIGLALGILIAWVIAPVQYNDTSPASLRAEFKDQYRSAIASAFNATQNLDRARARLALLNDLDYEQALMSQAERMIAEGNSPDSAFEIAVLVNAIKEGTQGSLDATGFPPLPSETAKLVVTSTLTQVPPKLGSSTPGAIHTPGPSPTFRPTATLKPTMTPLPTQGAPFILLTREDVCDSTLLPGLLMVEIRNKKRQPIAGQKLIISWSGGEESFFTGLKPEISDGYADYQMQKDILYTLRLATGSETVNDLSVSLCTDPEGNEFTGGIRLVFQQP
jgi:hypothetical protein